MHRDLLFLPVAVSFLACVVFISSGAVEFPHFRAPPHEYLKRTPNDRFTRINDAVLTGDILLDHDSPKTYVASLLRALDISPSTQLLVFSTTSLQLSRISPENPRAIYFNEDTYLGWVPGGKIEVIGIDPDWGAITYILEVPKPNAPPALVQRSTRCMKCHAAQEIGGVPGLLISSVVPGPGGGSLEAFRKDKIGHAIPFHERFGGWHVTGKHGIKNHWGNLTGTLSPAGLTKIPNELGQRFRPDRYPVPTSDVLAHLLLEHQAGFVDRFATATYRARAVLADAVPQIGESEVPIFLEREASRLVRYLLFEGETRFPAGGIEGDLKLKADFLKDRRQASNGTSLRDFDLSTRLFRHRCSYMIYSPSFTGLPPRLKERLFNQLADALSPESSNPIFSYLPVSEKQAIRLILRETLSGLPRNW